MTSLYDWLIQSGHELPKDKKIVGMAAYYEDEYKGFNKANALWLEALKQIEAPGERVSREEILGALARGYCSNDNKDKVMDADLINDMADEVIKVIAAIHAELYGRKK